MPEPLFKYTSNPMDLAMAACIVDDVERVLESDGSEQALREEMARLDRLIEFLEGKVDVGARHRMIPALRVKGQVLIKLGDSTLGVENLNQAFELYARCGEDEGEATKIVALLSEHSPEFRKQLALAASVGSQLPPGC